MSIFTAEQRRFVRDAFNVLSNRIPGVDLLKILDDHDDKFVSGFAEISATDATVEVAVGEAFDGKPAFAVLQENDGTALYVQHCTWDGSGNLTITVNAAATGTPQVAYWVDGR